MVFAYIWPNLLEGIVLLVGLEAAAEHPGEALGGEE